MKSKHLLKVLFALSMLFSVSACSDDDDNGNGGPTVCPPAPTAQAMYIMNQGNSYAQIASTISRLDFTRGNVTDSLFIAVNGISVGNTLQCGIICGSRMYIIAYDSNVLFAVNRNTLAIEKQLRIASPRALATDGKYVYVSTYDGFVQRLDTTSLSINASVAVGPNPEELTVANDHIYVAISDGLNYENGYANGCKVAKVSLSTFEKVKDIPVIVNPTKIVSDYLGNVYVISMGNYGDIPSTLQKINTADNVSPMGEASLMTILGSTLFVASSVTDWKTYETVNKYYKIDVLTGVRTDDVLSESVDFPTAVAINPTTYNIYVASDPKAAWGSADYNSAGYIFEYNSQGQKIATYKSGVHPVQLLFDVR